MSTSARSGSSATAHQRTTPFGAFSLFSILLLGLGAVEASAQTGPHLSTSAKFALGPDNNQALLLQTFRSAKQNLKVNAYDFGHATIADALIAAIKRGVTLELLLETQPFKNPARAMSTEGKEVAIRIFAAMKASKNPAHRIYLMGSNLFPTQEGEERARRRFNFNHAKYVIADDSRLHITSENFTSTGHPDSGVQGNRGWDMVVSDAPTVEKFLKIFAEDISTSSGDVLEIPISGRLPSFITRPPKVLEALAPFAPVSSLEDPSSEPRSRPPLSAIGGGVVKAIQVLTSPLALPALESYMESAAETLDLEFMSLPSQWYIGRQYTPNPLVLHLIRLAQAGVKVRALLNDDRVFKDPGDDANTANEVTVDYLNELARCHSLPIASKVVDTKELEITYIHNKGMIVDGRHVLISSINGTKNSIVSNRETAIAVDSPAAGKYFGVAFENDWVKSDLQKLTETFASCPPLPEASTVQRAFATPWSMAF